jgi:DNA-binding response OmpR family regulator
LKLLLVEDDKDLAQGLTHALQKESFVVSNAATGGAAKEQFVSFQPDLVVLDLGLPDIDGIDVLKYLRNKHDVTPVLILTARDALDDKVRALDIGADDYLAKPFEMPELLARLRAMSRRLGTASSSEMVIGQVTLDTAAHRVLVRETEVSLPRKEYMTLKALMESAGRVKTKDMLESNLYSWGEEIGSNTIEVHVSNLRKKLPEGFIKTIRGVGYTISQDKG